MIEDNLDSVKDALAEAEKSYIVDVAYNGVEGTYLSQVNDYDAIVVDYVLPDMDGIEVCRVTRSANVETPILFLSSKEDKNVKISSLDAGADSFVVKPLDPSEFLAELRALIRRKTNGISDGCIKYGKIFLDAKNREVRIDDKPVSLRRKEYDILEYLVFNKGKVVSKEELLEHVWRDGVYILSNTVEVHVKSLRDKLERYAGSRMIKTVPGFGYRLDEF